MSERTTGGLGPVTVSRRRLLAAAGATVGAVGFGSHSAFAQQATPIVSPVDASRDWRTERWVGTWAASPSRPMGENEMFPSQRLEFNDQTLRQIAHTSVGGDQVRVRLANTFGDVPLVIGATRLALRDADARIDPATDCEITFSGSPFITVPAGALALSDSVELALPDLSDVAVSVYLPELTSSSTVHGFACQTNFVSPAGDFTTEPDMPVDTTAQAWFFLSGIDVAASESTGVVVALGDSLTDGVFSTPDTNQRWPDLLAARFADADQGAMGVLNQGIGGNRILHDSPPDFGFGESALARLDRDVLAQAGVNHLIVWEGINDILLPATFGDPSEFVSADEIIAGLRQIVERAHERGIVVFGATLTPFLGSEMFFTVENETRRQAINTWIRDGGAFDAVLDFDAVVRDPDDPTRILPAYDGGDHLHFNDTGFHAIADSIDLDLFRE
jgi:lysophospholipase L1-like esterase